MIPVRQPLRFLPSLLLAGLDNLDELLAQETAWRSAVSPAPQQPLVPRCSCGQRVSSNRRLCRGCTQRLMFQQISQEIAAAIGEDETKLQAYLSEFPDPAEREIALTGIRPYLRTKNHDSPGDPA